MNTITPDEVETLLMLVIHYGSDWHDWVDKRYATRVRATTYALLYEAGYVEYRGVSPREARVTPEGLSFLQEVEHETHNT
jgi:hypothetical protein